jgi:putative tricarboxylic transport membrane protein
LLLDQRKTEGDGIMGKADRISGIPWLFFSVFIMIESYRMGLGNLHQPGPGFLYFWAAIVLAIMSSVVLIRGWKSKRAGEAKIALFGGDSILKVILVLISVFLYAFFMEVLGFIPVTLLFFIFLLGFVEKKGLFFTAFVSVLVTVIAYLIFERWLQSQLPRGILGFLRF